MMFNDEKIYNDTVEIVKCAVSGAGDNVIFSVDQLIDSVYKALSKLNEQGESSFGPIL